LAHTGIGLKGTGIGTRWHGLQALRHRHKHGFRRTEVAVGVPVSAIGKQKAQRVMQLTVFGIRELWQLALVV